ncbi:MAG: hypothetical protein ACT4QA_23120 [Panacagrimonas sp.]
MKKPSPTTYAYTALVRALCKSGALNLDDLMAQLGSARQQLVAIGESQAAALLGSLAENLQAVDE